MSRISDENIERYPNVSNLVEKIERLKFNKSIVLPKRNKSRVALRKKWINAANAANKQTFVNNNLYLGSPISPISPESPELIESPLISINQSSLHRINKKNTIKPKHNINYLIAKSRRGNTITKKNRNKVRIQQLKNFINTSLSPMAVQSAKMEYNRLKNNMTRRMH